MNRVISGLVVLAIGVGSWACKGDPQSTLNRGDAVKVFAAPTALFINQGEPELIVIEVLDAQGNQLGITDFAMASNNPGVTVAEDTTFNLVYDANGVATRPSPWTRARFEVTGTAFVNTTVTASGGGVTLDIPVRVVPSANLAVGISDLAPPLGDTLLITAAPNTIFTAASTITFASGPAPILVSVDPTGGSMLVLPGPNTNGQATITNVQVAYDPSLNFTVNSVDAVVNQTITDLGDPFSTTTPALGDTVVMTAPAGFVFQSTSTVTFPGAAAPVLAALSADSTQLSILVAPNTDTTATVTNFIHERLPQYPLTLFTTAAVISPVITVFPATYDIPAPAAGQVVRVTAGAGFSFAPTATVQSALVDARDPGGTYVDFVSVLGFTGPIVVDGVVALAAPQFELSLPADTDLTVGTTEPFAGTGSPGTAPTLVLPTVSGTSVSIYDAGAFDASSGFFGFPTRWYDISVPATTTYDITVEWAGAAGDDLGLYLLDLGQNILDAADSFGGGSGSQPETATIALTAGSYLWANLHFNASSIGVVRYIITAQ